MDLNLLQTKLITIPSFASCCTHNNSVFCFNLCHIITLKITLLSTDSRFETVGLKIVNDKNITPNYRYVTKSLTFIIELFKCRVFAAGDMVVQSQPKIGEPISPNFKPVPLEVKMAILKGTTAPPVRWTKLHVCTLPTAFVFISFTDELPGCVL